MLIFSPTFLIFKRLYEFEFKLLLGWENVQEILGLSLDFVIENVYFIFLIEFNVILTIFKINFVNFVTDNT